MSEPPAGDSQQDQTDDAAPKTPEEVYAFFSAMSVEHLEALADEAVAALSAARDRAEAEAAVVKMAPFFLDCTYPRISEDKKSSLRDSLDRAETKFGSLAKILGLEDDLAEKSAPLGVDEAVDLLLRHDLTPAERLQAARWVCDFPQTTFDQQSARSRKSLRQAVARFELRWGDLETVANGD